jgi:hypothetical protein
MNYFSCCYSLEESVEVPIKNGVTNDSIINKVDKIEENILENIIEPKIISLVGQDLSGVIHNIFKTDIETDLEIITNSEVNTILTIGENLRKPIIEKVYEIKNNIPFVNTTD